MHIAGQRVLVDELEFELGGLAEQRLELVGILQAGHLHHDPRIALADDRRFARAQFVDPLADHFGGAFHRIADSLVGAFLRGGEDHAVAVLDRHVPFAHQPGAVHRGKQQFSGAVHLAGIVEHEAEPAVAGGNVADADSRIGAAHGVAHVFFHVLEPLRSDLRGIRFKQDMAPAGEIEAEIDHRLRQGIGPADAGGRQQRGQRGKDAQAGDQP